MQSRSVFGSEPEPGIYVFEARRPGWGWYGRRLEPGDRFEVPSTDKDMLARAVSMTDGYIFKFVERLSLPVVVPGTAPAAEETT